LVCTITYRRQAKKFLKDAPEDIADRIRERIQQLAENPKCDEKLKPPLQELCKTRVGPYRIAYLLKPCNVIVVAIGERESFYDKLRHSL